ncbi:MAG: FAD-binding protein [Flavobacteriaceae bacterium]|nr:FAD-binding protein [Flavobacteriaceae bacterium]
MDSKLLDQLNASLKGELFYDDLYKSVYATDASVYRKIPLAVAYPKDIFDIKTLVRFADKQRTGLIPRAAGTSLAGQCVGDGIVVDVSKHFTKILGFDERKKTVTVQPGVIRDDLNRYLKPFGLFFGPNTSTSNRCMIGGMVGNNSSGTTSIQYGVTRDKIIQLNCILSDGSSAVFKELTCDGFKAKTKGQTLENKIYQQIYKELSQESIQTEIHNNFPNKKIHRRNNGYAVDMLLNCSLFGGDNDHINLGQLLCGSEGTLAFTTEITLQLDNLPPCENLMIAAHFNSIPESLEAVVVAMKHNLYTCELMDKSILDCTKNNREQAKNRFFIEGDPGAILMLEVAANTKADALKQAHNLIADLKAQHFGYAFPILEGNDIDKLINLRKAGLGLLGNIIGDKKAVACIEDTAVRVSDLPKYIGEFTKMMAKYKQQAIYYAHAGAGEIHLRPILNLKKQADVALFRTITTETALLVKRYGGSFSGEHGDGIVRSEFIPLMIGEKNYDLLKRLKNTFDPNNILNPGKIVNPEKMDANLRYVPECNEPEINTLLDFSDSLGILRTAEKCNGSGDCRKPNAAGGVMCPSYRATKNETDTTRARANALREFLTNSDQQNKFNHQELKQVFDLCLSCKACASECPSNVDVAALKAEFLYQYQKDNPPNFRTKLFAQNTQYAAKIGRFAFLANSIANTTISKKILGIATERSIPKIANVSFAKWFLKHQKKRKAKPTLSTLYLFNDEFTNFYDVNIGKDAVVLLENLGYEVKVIFHAESGRSAISKGFLEEAKVFANSNIESFKDLINHKIPLVGIEPSAILSFRDDYLRLAADKVAAKKLSTNCFTIEEFISKEFKKGHISCDSFTLESKNVKVHTHCHQKSLSNSSSTFTMLNIPKNYTVQILASGCCGMAGSFGYEKEHYDISMQIGEDSLFKKLRSLSKKTLIAANGTSCRHQIKEGTSRQAEHPVSILRQALL